MLGVMATRRWLTLTALAAALLSTSACFFSETDDDDGGTDPDAGEPCPAGRPHLVMGLRPTVYDQDNLVVRRDENLRACRGMTVARSYGDLWVVGGTSDGRDLLGFGSGRVLLVSGGSIVWEIEHESDYPVGSLFTIQLGGREVVGVLWMQYSGSWGEQIDLRELADGRLIQRFEVSSSVQRAGPALDGSADRLSAAYDSDGVQHYRVVAGADSLGTAGEWQIPRPSYLTGTISDMAVNPGAALIATHNGVLYWAPGLSPAFLGPIACRWPLVRNDPLPDPEDSEHLSAVADRGRDRTFLTIIDGKLLGAESGGSYLYRLTYRGECELLAEADEDHELTSLAWSGWGW